MPASNGTPKSFICSFDPRTNRHVAEALKLLDPTHPPNGWAEARNAVRSAEWALLKATSLNLGETLNLYRNQSREYQRLELPVGSLPTLVDDATALVAAVPEEAARLKVNAERRARRVKLASLRNQMTRDSLRHEAWDEERMGEVLALEESVAADEVAIAAERKERERLEATVERAKNACTDVLIDAMRAQIQKAAREGADIINPKSALWRAYPQMTPAPFKTAILNADAAATVAAKFGAELDVAEEFSRRLDPAGWETFCILTGRMSERALDLQTVAGK